MPVTPADILLLRYSRAPFYDFLHSFPREHWPEVAKAALPFYTAVSAEESDNFSSRLLDVVAEGSHDRLLSLVRGVFTEFSYDDFSQLEDHYHDVLAVMSGLLESSLEAQVNMPDSVEWILGSERGDMHICFNLRGSAEDAAGKVRLDSPADIRRVGVSFSAFDRNIDRWCMI